MARRIPAKKSCSSHLFGVVPSQAAQTDFVPELLKALTFCLRSYPGEISHSNSPNRELSKDILDVVVRRRKVALHTSSHLPPTEAGQSPDSTTSEGRRVSSEVRLGKCTQVLGGGWIVPARRPSEHTGLGPPPKGVNCNFSWPEFDKPYGVRKLSISGA